MSFSFENEKVESIEVTYKEEVKVENGLVDTFSKKINIKGKPMKLPMTLQEIDNEFKLSAVSTLQIEEPETFWSLNNDNHRADFSILPLADVKRVKDSMVYELQCKENKFYKGKP